MTGEYDDKLFVYGEKIIHCSSYNRDGCKTTYESKIKQKLNLYLYIKKNIIRYNRGKHSISPFGQL